MHASYGKIAVAMSGGVDSSVAAALLVREGYEVIGITMINTRFGENSSSDLLHCPPVRSARQIAGRLGIAHHAVEVSRDFESDIVSYFVEQYLSGKTPNPCVRCNRRMKFGLLLEYARQLGADTLATGHYARVEQKPWGPALLRGKDPAKDQSYMLANLSIDQVPRALFPLGNQTKVATRQLAQEFGLADAHLPDSQEVCFVPDDDYGAFLMARVHDIAPGPILNTRGERLGTHRGLIFYTVGQRKGLGVAAPRPLYVLQLDTARNALIVGFEEETLCGGLRAVEANWLVPPTGQEFRCEVQVRYRQRPIPCRVTSDMNGFTVRFDSPVRSVAPGQWAALFDGEVVLGGGFIREAFPHDGWTTSVGEQE